MICLAYDQDDKNPRSRKVTKKSSFLSWGLKNKLKSASTLSLPTDDHSGSLPWNKPCPTFPSSSSYNNDSALYWTNCRLSLCSVTTGIGVYSTVLYPLWIGYELCTVAAFPVECWAWVHVACMSLAQRWKVPAALKMWLCPNTVWRCFCWYNCTFSEQFQCLQDPDLYNHYNEQAKPAWVQHSIAVLGKTAATILYILTLNMQTGSNVSSSQNVFLLKRSRWLERQKQSCPNTPSVGH